MTEQERAIVLSALIHGHQGNYASRMHLLSQDDAALLVKLLDAYARPSQADLREKIAEMVWSWVSEEGEPEWHAIECPERDDVLLFADAILSLLPQTQAASGTTRLLKEHVEWVVNDIAELGVKIGDQFFWLYKGSSLVYEGPNEDTDPPRPHYWRYVCKREFGECCHPINYADPTRVGTVDMNDGRVWMVVPGTGHLDRTSDKEG